MAKAEPEKSCNDTVFKYVIDQKDLEAAKKQVVKAVGNTPVIFIEVPQSNNQVELQVYVTSLTPSQKSELSDLQHDGVMVKKIAEANFAVNQLSFDMMKKKS